MLITDLPIEIQRRIFSEIYWQERRYVSDVGSTLIKALTSNEYLPMVYDQSTRWWDDDLQAVPNLFPHTTASVCRLWQKILSDTPEYWTRFMLDVSDPACLPFDVFGWSKSEPLNVLIRSRPQETSEDAMRHENERVSSTFKALIPYIPSCKSIVFDVKYASSLPPPIPLLLNENRHLKTLIMDSEIGDEVIPMSLDIIPNTIIGQKIININRLSLHGAAFMELSRVDPTWVEYTGRFMLHNTLTLSHLECCWKTGSSYTIIELLKTLATAQSISNFVFKHARFIGDQPLHEESNADEPEFRFANSLTFEDVDPNFITAFAQYAYRSPIMHLTFKNCILPRLDAFQIVDLCLIDIPDAESLKNIMLRHHGGQITFTSCPGFNDDFLNWFGTNCRSLKLRILTIDKCDQFTLAGLRAFLEIRKVAGGAEDNDHEKGGDYLGGQIADSREEKEGSDRDVLDSNPLSFQARNIGSIEKLIVRSSGLRLRDEDKKWLKEYTDEGQRYNPITEIKDDLFGLPMTVIFPPPLAAYLDLDLD